nr:GH25 family lysozyme [Leptospira perolatii]
MRFTVLSGFLIFGALILFTLYQALNTGKIWFVYPSEKQYPIRGIDVSNHQGKINWAIVPKTEVSFVYIKATEGGDFQDKSFRANWRQAKNVGFPTGAYHFFTLCRSGLEQAQNFIRTVPKEANSLPPVLDLEFTGNCSERPQIDDVQKEIKDYLKKVDFHYGTKTVLYLTYEFKDKYLGKDFEDYPVWIRDIFKHPNTFSDLKWVLWQFNSRGAISGVTGPVDINVLNPDSSDSEIYK